MLACRDYRFEKDDETCAVGQHGIYARNSLRLGFMESKVLLHVVQSPKELPVVFEKLREKGCFGICVVDAYVLDGVVKVERERIQRDVQHRFILQNIVHSRTRHYLISLK